MLVLSRKVGERIEIGDDVTVVVSRISGNRVTIAIDAPSNIKVIRGELKRFRDEFADGDSGRPSKSACPNLDIDLPNATPRLAR